MADEILAMLKRGGGGVHKMFLGGLQHETPEILSLSEISNCPLPTNSMVEMNIEIKHPS